MLRHAGRFMFLELDETLAQIPDFQPGLTFFLNIYRISSTILQTVPAKDCSPCLFLTIIEYHFYDLISFCKLGIQFLLFNLHRSKTMTNLQTYKYVFSATIGELSMSANLNCPIFVNWKRSQQSAISQTVDISGGKANFNNELLKLPVNMYFDKDAKCFQEKKSSFTFTMKTPKGDRVAGMIYVDLSKMLNNKQPEVSEVYALEKCPIKESSVRISIAAECLGEKTDDTQSVSSVILFNANSGESILSINSTKETKESKAQQPIRNGTPASFKGSTAVPSTSESKDKQVAQLKQQLRQANSENQQLKKQLDRMKQSLKGDSTKEQILKSKAAQDKLEEEVASLRKKNQDHENEIEQVRKKLEQAYSNLYSSLSKHFL